MAIPAFRDLPNTVQLLAPDGTVLNPELTCRLWDPPTRVDANDGNFPVMAPGQARTMWCDFDPMIEAGKMILTSPVGDGQSGVAEKFTIVAVDNTAGIGWRMQCRLERLIR